MLLAHERLHHPHASEVLLQHRVETVELALHPQVEPARSGAEDRDQDHDHWHEREHHQRKLPAGGDEHRHRSDHPDRRSGEDAKGHHHDHLRELNVARRAGDQISGAELIQVGEREALHLAHQGAAHVRGEPLRCPHREEVIPEREQRRD